MLTENEDDGFLINLDLAVKTTNDRIHRYCFLLADDIASSP